MGGTRLADFNTYCVALVTRAAWCCEGHTDRPHGDSRAQRQAPSGGSAKAGQPRSWSHQAPSLISAQTCTRHGPVSTCYMHRTAPRCPAGGTIRAEGQAELTGQTPKAQSIK